jgi:hypothetical protein
MSSQQKYKEYILVVTCLCYMAGWEGNKDNQIFLACDNLKAM